ncbi:MAG TPA: aminotransferase class V-fold PLP-dependent enzyme [Abditibacteriaceae bacterium]|jgi:selenocysteine lyase/cysteine desulfurase
MVFPSDENAFQAWRRDAFPFLGHKIFLTHASVSHLPAAARDALQNYASAISTHGQFDNHHEHLYRSAKERAARLMRGANASADEVAFAGSTSHALGIVATSIDWKAGDNLVVCDGDFPANVVTWKNLAFRHDIEIRLVPPLAAPRAITPEDLAPLVDNRTRLVSLASANFLSGVPLDVPEMGKWLRERNVLFCLDAIQTLGAIRLDAEYVDFVCADAHKWLLGPNGIAILWTRKEVLQTLRPAILGWLATAERENWFEYGTTPHPTAERFEPGARNYLGAVALEASLAQYEEVGQRAGDDFIEERVVDLRDYAARALQSRGCELLWNPDGFRGERRAGIVSFRPPQGDTQALYEKLDTCFSLSLRQDRNREFWLRMSPHWMNTRADIDALAAAL